MIALFVLFGCAVAQAQTAKIGYVDSRGVSEQLPEVKAAYAQLNEFSKKKQEELQREAEAFQKRVQEAEQGAANMSDQMKAATQKELEAQQEKIQIKQQSAQTEIANREKQIFEPIEKRIQEAITSVANENGYTHVFAKEVLLHSPASEDISSLVVKKLLATAPKAATPPPANTSTNAGTSKPAGSSTSSNKKQ